MDPHGKLGGTNAAPHDSNNPEEDAFTQDSDNLSPAPTQADPAPNPGETEANCKLREVYGNTIHQNDGRHLDRDIANDLLSTIILLILCFSQGVDKPKHESDYS